MVTRGFQNFLFRLWLYLPCSLQQDVPNNANYLINDGSSQNQIRRDSTPRAQTQDAQHFQDSDWTTNVQITK